MMLQEEDTREFSLEAADLLDLAERSILALDKGDDFQAHLEIFHRSIHSLKGGAGLMQLTELQSHLHHVENLASVCKTSQAVSKPQIDFFLKAIDAARSLLEGTSPDFHYAIEAAPPSVPENTPVIPIHAASRLGAAKESEKTNSGYSGKIMVIDDEQEIAEILADALRVSGFEVIIFTEPLKAVAALEQVQPYVVLSDFTMPKMNGMEVLQKVKEFDSDIPVVFCSGYVTKDILLKSIAAGVFGVIEKPFQETQLIQQVISAHQRYEVQRLLRRSIKLLQYQFTDLDEYLKSQGKEKIRAVFAKELNDLVEHQQRLRDISQKKAA